MRSFLEILFRSPIGRLMSAMAMCLAFFRKPRMIYGYTDPTTRRFRKFVRISDSSVILEEKNLSIGDSVWIGHYSIIDASGGLTIEEGCQMAAWVGIYTHSSHIAIRLYGREYVNVAASERAGYIRGAVKIGAYSFLGAKTTVLPGVTIGKGCVIAAGSVVNEDVPDFSIVAGSPGRIVGSTINMDSSFLATCENPTIFESSYYDAEAYKAVSTKIQEKSMSKRGE
jgi:acetyltransferase-like isoleucine patch superfamily enzyme